MSSPTSFYDFYHCGRYRMLSICVVHFQADIGLLSFQAGISGTDDNSRSINILLSL